MIRVIMLAAIVTAAGCSTATEKPAPRVTPSAATGGPEAIVALGPLADASLKSGECGMILWTLDENRPAPVFRYVAGKGGEIVAGGRRVQLSRLETGGAAGFGVYERQTFTSADGLAVRVDSRFSLGFDGGSYLERGLVTVESPDGWRAVSPAAGIAGCRG